MSKVKNGKEYAKINSSNSCIINGRKVPVGAIYGKYREVSFICLDTHTYNNKVSIEFFQNTWKRFQVGSDEPIYKLIMTAGDAHAKFGTGNVASVTSHGPQAKKAQADFIRYKGSCYSQSAIDGKGYAMDWNDRPEGSFTREDRKYGWNARGCEFSPEERARDVARHGKCTDNPNTPFAKKNSMYVHDVQKGRDKKDTVHVEGQPKSKTYPDKPENVLRDSIKKVEADRNRRLNDCGSTSRPTGHAFTGKPGGNAVRKVIHGEQV